MQERRLSSFIIQHGLLLKQTPKTDPGLYKTVYVHVPIKCTFIILQSLFLYLKKVLQGILDRGTGRLPKQSGSDFPLDPCTLGHLHMTHAYCRD